MTTSRDHIAQVYIISAQLLLTSPLLIATGESDEADKEVVLFHKDRKSKKPYIPASSFAGALLHHIEDIHGSLHLEGDSTDTPVTIDADLFTYLTGSSENHQSHLIPEDLISFDSYTITTRDGVAINLEKRTAEKGAKYDYQIIEPGITFHFKAMIKVRDAMKEKDIDAFFHYLNYTLVDDKDFGLGANTNNGFGKFFCAGINVVRYDFPTDAERYFEYLQKLNAHTHRNIDYYQCGIGGAQYSAQYTCERHVFRASIEVELKTNAIIGSSQDPDTDKSTLQSNGVPVISGKSIRGSIVAMMEEILDNGNYSSTFKKKALLGHKNKGDGDYTKSKLSIGEIRLEGAKTVKYTRNRIDRFTGGTIEGALFNSTPIQAGERFTIDFAIRDPELTEVDILMHTIRELWVGRLCIGGEKSVGRGVLKGIGGTISCRDTSISFDNIVTLKEKWTELPLIS